MNIFLITSWLLVTLECRVAAQPAQPTTYKFDFGAGKVAPGYLSVTPETGYTQELGYGFDFGTSVTSQDRGGKNALHSDFVTSERPFYFSVALPEGNYNVTVTLGDAKSRASTVLKAESRRLLLEETVTKPGQFITRTFTLNIKHRRISSGAEVHLAPRELAKLDWDDKLTLEFNGTRPCLAALEIALAPQAVTVFLAGNSTVVNQENEPWAAWGQMLPRFLKPGVAVANHAESGLTLGSFLSSRRLEKVLSVLKPGDYLFIEFGHNDQKEKGPDDGAYKSYTERLRLFVQQARGQGGIPVILTSTARRTFDAATVKLTNSLGDYPAAARQVAQQEGVALIDLNLLTTQLYEAMGVEASKQALVHYPANTYPGQPQPLADNTHFNPFGAYEVAKCVVEGIKANKLPLAAYLLRDTPPFDPAKPDAPASWHWADSPRSTAVKPAGN